MYGNVESMYWAPNYLTLSRYEVLSRKFKKTFIVCLAISANFLREVNANFSFLKRGLRSLDDIAQVNATLLM